MNQAQDHIALYRTLYLVRRAEQAIIDRYNQNEMKTPMHMSTGGEHIAVGVCHALRGQSEIYSTYRSHAVYLANTLETDRFFAELYGRRGGTADGKAGSMHLSAVETGFMGASAIVGSVIPPAVGSAYANKIRRTGKLSCVFFGDGATDEGNFWESLNFASSLNVPMLMVCEDNGLAVHTPKSARHGYQAITEVVRQFRCLVYSTTTTDVAEIAALTTQAATESRERNMPAFLYVQYHRYLEHVGINEDYNAGYRERAEGDLWKQKDPVSVFRAKLLASGVREAELVALEAAVDAQIRQSQCRAQEAPFPAKDDLHKDVYHA